MHNKILIPLILLLTACSPKPKDAAVTDSLPPIYPDYAGVTVPENIAPLNFLVRGYDAVYATAEAGGNVLEADCSGNEAVFPVKGWHKLLQRASGGDITIRVSARRDGKWTEFLPFGITVSPDRIDPYLTYRLIEPDYEVFSRLQIMERNLENHDERTLVDYNMVGNRCMNCHTHASGRGDLSFLYVRGPGGGMILNDGGKLRKLALKTDEMAQGSVYAQFSPSGRWLVFSANKIIPAFHSDPRKRLEVFDTMSDVYVADLANNTISTCPQLSDTLALETFPTFSPDGKSIYFCTADGPVRVEHLDRLQYSLCRIDFDEATGTFGSRVDTIARAAMGQKSSVCHPRVSPDGRYMLYTVADYGTFPIWHRESDQRMLDLHTGEVNTLDAANSDMSDTYHSWSTDGRWFVFASKRDDGLYGKPYFCHVDIDGTVSKPFVMPQKSPSYYDNCLKSHNAPELGKEKATFSAGNVADAMLLDAESFTLQRQN